MNQVVECLITVLCLLVIGFSAVQVFTYLGEKEVEPSNTLQTYYNK